MQTFSDAVKTSLITDTLRLELVHAFVPIVCLYQEFCGSFRKSLFGAPMMDPCDITELQLCVRNREKCEHNRNMTHHPGMKTKVRHLLSATRHYTCYKMRCCESVVQDDFHPSRNDHPSVFLSRCPHSDRGRRGDDGGRLPRLLRRHPGVAVPAGNCESH